MVLTRVDIISEHENIAIYSECDYLNSLLNPKDKSLHWTEQNPTFQFGLMFNRSIGL